VDGLTSFASPSAASFLSQDGFSSGELSRISIDAKGQIVGGFTNGDTRVLGQVAMATFGAPDQLMRVGGTLFQAMPPRVRPTSAPPRPRIAARSSPARWSSPTSTWPRSSSA
jgi:flagellar hook protein FlgE